MPKQQKYVVAFNSQTDSYLTGWTGQLEYENCTWGALENAIEFDTQEEVDDIADKINSGTVGMPRPH